MEDFKDVDELYFYLKRYMQLEEKRKSSPDPESPEEMEHLAYHDALTDLKNRRSFEKDMKELSGDNHSLGILSIDANQLKMMNDTYGHQHGDVFLKEIACSMEEVFGKENSYRTGGDEFAVILTDRDKKEISNLIGEFKNSLQGKKVEGISISASVGYAVCSDGKYPEALKEADRRMYEDKKRYQAELQKGKRDCQKRERYHFSITYGMEGLVLLYVLAVLALVLLN